MRHALYFAPFDEMSDPTALLDVAVAAEANGWDGMFLWDHVHRPEAAALADVWTLLAAIAARTTRLRLGPMVTPLTRRRMSTLVRQTVTVDNLSRGRLTLGVGLGVDSGGELTRFGEITDPHVRAQRLDEGLAVLTAAWTGEPVTHHGEHVLVDDVTFLPRPTQRPGIPIWCAARGEASRPIERAARFQGMYPIDVDRPRLERIRDEVVAARGGLDGFDIAVRVSPLDDPALLGVEGVTWAMSSLPPDMPAATVLAIASEPPDPEPWRHW